MAIVGQAPSWGKHFHDDSGSNPAVGWEVWTFESRTEDRIATYQDIDGTDKHSNPIILDSRGEYPGQGLFLVLDQAYTLELRRSNGGSSVTTVDGVVVSSGGITISSITGSEYIDVDSTNPEVPVVSLNDAVIAMIEANSNLIAANEITINDNTYSIEDNAGDIALIQVAQTEIVTELANKIDSSEKGVVNGVATLDALGKVPANQLNGVVAGVQEAYVIGFPPFESGWLSEIEGGDALTPSDNTIYYILSAGDYENKEYRWGGTTYIELSASLVLGNTSSTAFRGDFGQIAYDHTFDNTTNPHAVTADQVGLGNVDNTSDASKPVSIATLAALADKADDSGVVHTSGDESVNGNKFFSNTIYMHDGLSMDSYKLPSGGASPEPGQVLKYPETGDILEWGNALDESTTLPVAQGIALTARITNPSPGSSWSDTLIINRDNGLLDSEDDPDDLLNLDTGVFTAPADGYYYLNAQANLVPPFTGSSSSQYRAKVSTYFVKSNVGYFNMSNASTGYLNDSIGSSSNGIVYLDAGETIYAEMSYYVGVNYTPSSHTVDSYITRCSFSAHQVGIVDTESDSGSGGISTVYTDGVTIEGDGSIVHPLSSSTGSIAVEQTSHGFIVLTPVFRNELNTWVAAQANDGETLATHVVKTVTDTDNFIVTNSGNIYAESHGLIIDDYYFTSDTNAGAMVADEPDTYSNPMFKVVDANNVEAFQWRPYKKSTASTGTSTTTYKLLEEMFLSQDSGDTYHTGVNMEVGKNYRITAYSLLVFGEKRCGGFITNPFNTETLDGSAPWQSFEKNYGTSITSSFWITQTYGVIYITNMSSSNPFDAVYRIEELIED